MLRHQTVQVTGSVIQQLALVIVVLDGAELLVVLVLLTTMEFLAIHVCAIMTPMILIVLRLILNRLSLKCNMLITRGMQCDHWGMRVCY